MRHLDAADVGRNHDQVVSHALLDGFHQNRCRIKVIHGNVEEALDLACVQIHGEHAVDTGGDQEIGHQLCRNRHSRTVFAILACIAKERQHGGDAVGAGTPHGIHHDEQFHQVLVGGRAGGLNDVHIAAADVLMDLDEGLAVRKGVERQRAGRHSEMVADGIGQGGMGGAAEYLERVIHEGGESNAGR